MIRILMILIVLSIGEFVYADYRYYAWTYQFITMLPEEVELEFYTSFAQEDLSKSDTVKWKRQLEVETGLTKNWDFSLYFLESYKPADGKTKFDEIKLRTRYKLVEKDKFFIDPLIYLEYKIKTDRRQYDKWETKLILAKDINKLNIALNIISESEARKKAEIELGYVFGISYGLVRDSFRLGIESKGNLEEEKYMIGPSLSLKGKKIWSSVGTLFKLNKNADDFQLQWIIGILL